MEKNFLAGNDAVAYLAGPVHKKYFTFVWSNPFSAYVFYDWFLTPVPLRRIYMQSMATINLTCLIIEFIISTERFSNSLV